MAIYINFTHKFYREIERDSTFTEYRDETSLQLYILSLFAAISPANKKRKPRKSFFNCKYIFRIKLFVKVWLRAVMTTTWYRAEKG